MDDFCEKLPRQDLFMQVLEMHVKFGWQDETPAPAALSPDERRYRIAAMLEELSEYAAAPDSDLEAQLDGLVDLIVFALGTAVRHGFYRFDEAFERVMAANKAKVPGASGKRGGWKRDLIKPPGWKPADLSDLVVSSAEDFAAVEDAADRVGMLAATRSARASIHAVDDVSAEDRQMPSRFAADEELPFNPILKECSDLIMRKSRDYGDKDLAKRQYHPYGDASYLQMLHTKLRRLENVRLRNKGQQNFESARDSVLDMINYAAFYAAWLDEEAGK